MLKRFGVWTDSIQQAFEVAGTKRTTPFTAAAGKEKEKAAAADSELDGDGDSLGSFTCLRIDGSVPTVVRYGAVRARQLRVVCFELPMGGIPLAEQYQGEVFVAVRRV